MWCLECTDAKRRRHHPPAVVARTRDDALLGEIPIHMQTASVNGRRDTTVCLCVHPTAAYRRRTHMM